MRPSSYVLLALAISLAASLPSLLRHRPHGNFLGVILAGEWAGSTLASGDTIHDRYFFPTYLAGLESQVVKTVTPPPGGGKHYVIAQDADLEKLPELRELIRDGRAIAVQSFPRESMSKQRDVRVYEVTRGK